MHGGFLRFILRRAAFAAVLVLVVSSAALVLARLAPAEGTIGDSPATIAAERHRLGLDRPLIVQYTAWLSRSARLDFGESVVYRSPVFPLLRDHAGRTALLGLSALALATLAGIPLGVFTGSRRGGLLGALVRGGSVVLLSVPSLITSLVLLLIAARTGWLPTGGYGDAPPGAGVLEALAIHLRHLILPAVAIALPLSASLERLQSRAMRGAGRAVPARGARARRAAPPPHLAQCATALAEASPRRLRDHDRQRPQRLVRRGDRDVVAGAGVPMYRALQGRDIYLVAGCAAAGSLFLAVGILLSDVALAAVDPRVEERA